MHETDSDSRGSQLERLQLSIPIILSFFIYRRLHVPKKYDSIAAAAPICNLQFQQLLIIILR